jgi:tetratricopeptide (TPR) repeat protein
MKMEYFKSATLYYSNVIEKYHDTEFAEPALLGKAQSLVARKRYKEAEKEINRFLDRYPNSSLKNDASGLRDDIETHLKSSSAGFGLSSSYIIAPVYA